MNLATFIVWLIAAIQTKTGNLVWSITASDCDRARTACYNSGERCDEICDLCEPCPSCREYCNEQYATNGVDGDVHDFLRARETVAKLGGF